MARVEWSRYSGDDVELVVAIMLSREKQNAQRIKPSRGDKGIDMLVPVDNGFDVYQVKSYTGQIDSSRKRHITRSWERLRQYTETSGLTVLNWYLTLPEDPTTENLTWFNNLTSDAEFPCAWRGLAYIEGLAAKYPDVVDYYFRDGKERLEAKIQNLMTLVGMDATAESVPAALSDDILANLHDLINSLDPHFYYDFAVETVARGDLPPKPDVTNRPRLLAACQYGRNDRCITTFICARYNGAELDRPVPGRIGFDLTEHPEARKQLQSMLDYGVSFTSPPGTASAIWDLPGGFGGSYKDVTLRLGESHVPGGRPFRLRLRVIDQSDTQIAVVFISMEMPTTGQTGRYVRSIGKEEHGAFTVQTIFDRQERAMSIAFEPCNLAGTIPSRVRDGVFFMSQLRPPNAFQILPEFGPPGAERNPVTELFVWTNEAQHLLDILDALSTIQENTHIQVHTPDLTITPIPIASRWCRAAKLLQGERLVQPWSELTFDLHPGAEEILADFGLSAVALEQQLTVEIGDVEIELGTVVSHMPIAKVVSVWSDLETRQVSATYVPVGVAEMSMYMPGRGTLQ